MIGRHRAAHGAECGNSDPRELPTAITQGSNPRCAGLVARSHAALLQRSTVQAHSCPYFAVIRRSTCRLLP